MMGYFWLLISLFCDLDRPCVMLVFSGFGFLLWPNGLGVPVLVGLVIFPVDGLPCYVCISAEVILGIC
jgi:hypothetical protein